MRRSPRPERLRSVRHDVVDDRRATRRDPHRGTPGDQHRSKSAVAVPALVSDTRSCRCSSQLDDLMTVSDLRSRGLSRLTPTQAPLSESTFRVRDSRVPRQPFACRSHPCSQSTRMSGWRGIRAGGSTGSLVQYMRSCILVIMADRDERERVAGDLLRLARVKAGLTQAALAARAGVAQPAISAYENGNRQPTLPTLQRLLAAAGFELRMRLEAPDDQARAEREWAATRPEGERRRWAAEQRAQAGRQR